LDRLSAAIRLAPGVPTPGPPAGGGCYAHPAPDPTRARGFPPGPPRVVAGQRVPVGIATTPLNASNKWRRGEGRGFVPGIGGRGTSLDNSIHPVITGVLYDRWKTVIG